MANTYSSPGTYRAPGMGRQRQPGMGSTGQEAFRPGGSADPSRIDKGFLTGEKAPLKQQPLPSYSGVAPGPKDRARAQNPGGISTMDVTPWEAERDKKRMQYGGLEGHSQPYNPPGAKPQPDFLTGSNPTQQNQSIGRAHVCTPVTVKSRMPSS